MCRINSSKKQMLDVCCGSKMELFLTLDVLELIYIGVAVLLLLVALILFPYERFKR